MALGGIGAGIGSGLPLELLDGATGGAAAGRRGAGGVEEAASGTPDFAGMLRTKLGELNAMQADSAKAQEEVATGRVDDLAQTMLRIEQSSVAMQMTTQVRNKVVEAYQEVLRMQM